MRVSLFEVSMSDMVQDNKPFPAVRPIPMRYERRTVSTAECVRFLSDPASYGGRSGRVDVKETHKSWVFLTTDQVYKLKKPIRNQVQDLTTLAARAANTRKEIHLNRRLAPDVYLGAVPLTLEDPGELALGGNGVIVDWLVHMRRVPETFMLDQMIVHGDVPESAIEALINLLAEFYQNAPRSNLTPDSYVAHFEQEHAENRRCLTDNAFPLDPGPLNALLDQFEHALGDHRTLLEGRVREGKIVEGHGDLRPEHVCLVDPPAIIDCLEFNLSLRLVDPFDELVFLGLECSLLGAPCIQERLVRGCAKRLDDHPPDRVLSFYEAYRALLRARLCLAHLFEPDLREPSKWLPKARNYLGIAEQSVLTLASREDRQTTRSHGTGGLPLQKAVRR